VTNPTRRSFLLLSLLAACSREPGSLCALVWRADMPIRLRDNLIFIPARINDQPAVLLLDTGAERTILTEAAVTRLKLRRDLQQTGKTTGIGGTSATYTAVMDNFAIGVFGLPVDRIQVGQFPLPAFGDIQPDGLLGADIALAFDLDIDLPNHRLTVYRARSCLDSRPPWNFPYDSVAGVTPWRDRLLVPMSLNGAEGKAILDTGAQRSIVQPAFAARAGVTQQMLESDPGTMLRGASREMERGHMHVFDTVQVGTEIAHHVRLPVAKLPNAEEDGLIGGDFLSGRRIWLSAASHQVFFTAAAV
jgi:predicted aspartyl protease